MNWAANKSKLQRAITKLGTNASEQDILTEYTRLGGYVIPNLAPKVESKEQIKEEITEQPKESVIEPVQEKKKGRPKKNENK